MDKKYYVIGPRNAWDTVDIGLFESYSEALRHLPGTSSKDIIREATPIEITTHQECLRRTASYGLTKSYKAGTYENFSKEIYHRKNKTNEIISWHFISGLLSRSLPVGLHAKEHTPQRPFIDLPEEIGEAKSGTLLYVESATPDTISLAFDNMDDLISLWRNDSGDSIWVDLQTMVIYNAARHEEKQFQNSKDLAKGLLTELNK